MSKIQERILKTLLHSDGHMNPNWIFNGAKKQFPISITETKYVNRSNITGV